MGGIRIRTQDDGAGSPPQTYIITGIHLAMIDWDPVHSPMEHLVLDAEDLADKSDADAFAKAIAVLQILLSHLPDDHPQGETHARVAARDRRTGFRRTCHLHLHRLFSRPSQLYSTCCGRLEAYARGCLCEYLGADSS